MVKRFNLVFFAVFFIPAITVHAASIDIDATKTYQTIDGFGACNAWTSGKITAALATQFWQEDTIDGHVGMSILRTRIDPAGYVNGDTVTMKKAFQIYPGIKIWSAVWTPPTKFKTNGGAVGGSLKSDSASQKGYADFLVKYVQDIKKNAGIDLYAISCQNEPDYNPSYESCSWTGDQFKVFVRDYWGPACKAAGITARRMISESYRNALTVSDPSLKDPAAAAYVDIIGEHLYGGGPNPYPLADSLHKQYWETENSGMGGPDESIANGVMYANIVHKCLAKCNMNAYHYWWYVNNNGDDEGLCNSSGKPTPRLYAIGNFSKFIRPGFVRIDATPAPSTSITASAYFGASYGRLVVVAINAGSEAKQDFTVKGFTGEPKATPWVTDASHNLAHQASIAIADNAFSYTLTAKSVTTFVIWDGKTPPPGLTVVGQAGTHTSLPTAGLVNLGSGWRAEAPSAKEPWTIQVVTPSGRHIVSQTIRDGRRSALLEKTTVLHGVMLVRIAQGGNVWTFRIARP
jgi:glucuronoarabinoxylan endo-1,4-beta-xylanase